MRRGGQFHSRRLRNLQQRTAVAGQTLRRWHRAMSESLGIQALEPKVESVALPVQNRDPVADGGDDRQRSNSGGLPFRTRLGITCRPTTY